jgi:hypothetical protein
LSAKPAGACATMARPQPCTPHDRPLRRPRPPHWPQQVAPDPQPVRARHRAGHRLHRHRDAARRLCRHRARLSRGRRARPEREPALQAAGLRDRHRPQRARPAGRRGQLPQVRRRRTHPRRQLRRCGPGQRPAAQPGLPAGRQARAAAGRGRRHARCPAAHRGRTARAAGGGQPHRRQGPCPQARLRGPHHPADGRLWRAERPGLRRGDQRHLDRAVAGRAAPARRAVRPERAGLRDGLRQGPHWWRGVRPDTRPVVDQLTVPLV